MTYEKFLEIVAESEPVNWVDVGLGLGEGNRLVFTGDIGLSIDVQEDERDKDHKVTATWATGFTDPDAYASDYSVNFNGQPILVGTMASVDGGRAILPVPRLVDGMRVSAAEWNVGRILTHHLALESDEYDDYMDRAGITRKQVCWN